MPGRLTRTSTLLIVVLVALLTVIVGCSSQDADEDAVWELSEGTATAVAKSGEPIPTPIQMDGLVPANIVSPITAIFYEQTTEYSVTIGSPVDSGEWSGGQFGFCGDDRVDNDGYRLTWHHPHPPCDATTNHADQPVTYTVEIPTYEGAVTVYCRYQGSAPGTGEPCTWRP
ncbi:hypothetical protein JYU04_01925 [Dehalococcoides mccartyi]|nr:hypothetical protein [Dehalococcoides mccartyi]